MYLRRGYAVRIDLLHFFGKSFGIYGVGLEVFQKTLFYQPSIQLAKNFAAADQSRKGCVCPTNVQIEQNTPQIEDNIFYFHGFLNFFVKIFANIKKHFYICTVLATK
jgi:hypothetical protein